ncbi:hypothetical protein M0R45_026610 [Rubus argutus]|uniref:Uncharacterized protein n=1 Tax=Rubus argutus TaxID=59490 RepID=A0AAW1WYI0_RUBAR
MMKNMSVLVLVLVLCVMSSNMEQSFAQVDCYDACSTGCVSYFNNPRLMSRCDRKCQIKCGPEVAVIPPVNNGTNSSPIINNSAIFGHCPPENSIAENSPEIMMEATEPYNSQVHFDFAGRKLEKIVLVTIRWRYLLYPPIWRTWGAGNDRFKAVVADMVKLNKIDILAICEPKVQFCKASDTLMKLGFTDYKLLKLMVFSGGLWLLWNNNKFTVDVLDAAFQAISLKVTIPGLATWILTVLYASPNCSLRNNLWCYLENLFSMHRFPWILIGDYNELVAAVDKSFGSLSGRFGGLKRWVERNALLILVLRAHASLGQTTELKNGLTVDFAIVHGELYFLKLYQAPS